MWDFETDAAYQADLDWADRLVREEIEPLPMIIPHIFDLADPVRNAIVRPLQRKVKARGLWATHLGPELGGKGHGQVKLALLNEVLGRARYAPMVFGCAAPDTGNAEILAHYGTAEHKEKWLQPLLDGEIQSCFSMTEPQGGSDPKEFTCKAWREGDDWVIEGEKWFSSNARYAAFLIAMVVTDPEGPPHARHTMLIVPADAPGLEIIRNVGFGGWGEKLDSGAEHAHVRYNRVRVPVANQLGPRGAAFAVAQTRLGGGRIHHAMRTVGMARAALDMMKERLVSRRTQGQQLARKQMMQEVIADSWIELEQFRLLLLQVAWKIDKLNDYNKVRGDIAAVKVAMTGVLKRMADRAIQVHGSFGLSDQAPFVHMLLNAYQLGLADGPTEVHKVALARELLKDVAPCETVFPSYARSVREAAAREKHAEVLKAHGRW
ncbi:acyl-CoA dehydrogenase family protein [Novosphingobium bradum]|uniref:Acyl-CoA dehydrogenase family protein n=1 Tax=Novosphingobium bradum TaxID=1737444 RepID=A0ABV7IJS5_9SPHN